MRRKWAGGDRNGRPASGVAPGAIRAPSQRGPSDALADIGFGQGAQLEETARALEVILGVVLDVAQQVDAAAQLDAGQS
jgi:hypothetical protein